MSILIFGRTQDLAFEITDGGVRVAGSGQASIGVLTPAGEPPDDTRYEPPIAWSLESPESDGRLPEHLRDSRILKGIDEAFDQRKDRDLIVLWRGKADHGNTDPPVGCFIIVSPEKIRRIVELLPRAPGGTPSKYVIDAGIAVVSFYDETPSGWRYVRFNEWMKSGDARFVYGRVAFTIGPSRSAIRKLKTIAKRTDTMSAQLTSLRRWVIGLTVLVALSILAYCGTR